MTDEKLDATSAITLLKDGAWSIEVDATPSQAGPSKEKLLQVAGVIAEMDARTATLEQALASAEAMIASYTGNGETEYRKSLRDVLHGLTPPSWTIQNDDESRRIVGKFSIDSGRQFDGFIVAMMAHRAFVDGSK